MPSSPPGPRRWLRRMAWLVALPCALLLGCYILRAPVLTGLAEAWVVADPTTNADAIVVLGGVPHLRAVAAALLYHEGVAPRILYMDNKVNPAVELGVMPSEAEVTRRLLLSNNVPPNAMVAVGHGVASTFDESRAVRAWLATNNAKSILIATDLSHTRRARWVFRKELEGTGVQVHVHAIIPKEYNVSNWWRDEQGLIAFQNEWLKFCYYWLKY
ncbi:MAG: YdcF family protein [Limisphaerales bacterium]